MLNFLIVKNGKRFDDYPDEYLLGFDFKKFVADKVSEVNKTFKDRSFKFMLCMQFY